MYTITYTLTINGQTKVLTRNIEVVGEHYTVTIDNKELTNQSVTIKVIANISDFDHFIVEGKEIKELGSHHMFIAEVLSIDADEKYIDEKGAFDISKCDLISYANGGYYSQGKKLGRFGFSVQTKKKRR